MSEYKEYDAQTQAEVYEKATELCRGSFIKEKVAAARDMFRSLGDYRDSAALAEKCADFLAWEKGNTVTYGHADGEPIRWRVLEEDGRGRLLFAEKPVAFLPYHRERDHTNWSECSLRRWLNKDFMEQCFTLSERMDILLTPVRNDAEERWKVENGPSTRDKAFVFNWPELEGYFPTKEGRACGQWYWLRGHGWSMLSPMAIYTDGTLYEYGVNKNSDEVGVRPAMWVRKKIL